MVTPDAPVVQTPTPMYASNHTYQTFIDWLADMSVIPSQIDRSLWGTKFSGSGGAQLMTGLRFLKLLDGERPTDLLKELVATPKDQRKSIFERVLRGAYGDELLDDLPTMTPGLLDRRLRDLGTTDATHRKALSFFINAVKETNVPVPGVIAKKARNRAVSVSKKRRIAGTSDTPGTAKKAPESETAKQTSTGLDSLKTKYIEMLMEKASEGDASPELLNRIEALLGFPAGDSKTA